MSFDQSYFPTIAHPTPHVHISFEITYDTWYVEILLENNELLVPALCQTISRKFLEEIDADDPKPQDTATSGFANETQCFGGFCAEVDKLISENYTYRKLENCRPLETYP